VSEEALIGLPTFRDHVGQITVLTSRHRVFTISGNPLMPIYWAVAYAGKNIGAIEKSGGNSRWEAWE